MKRKLLIYDLTTMCVTRVNAIHNDSVRNSSNCLLRIVYGLHSNAEGCFESELCRMYIT